MNFITAPISALGAAIRNSIYGLGAFSRLFAALLARSAGPASLGGSTGQAVALTAVEASVGTV